MNTLGYGLLSLLSHSPLSGYDLMLRIQPFWPAKHSQIYPLLANLEKDEQVRFEVVAQSDKPDKKVYSITDEGIASLQEWLSVPASDPVMRDELMLKAYCLSIVDAAISRKLFVSRLDHYREKMKLYEDKISQMRDTYGLKQGEMPAYSSSLFGHYVLLHKAFLTCRTNIEWCEWVLGVLPASEV
jgi:PadR family transcriptional regulator, regulatory protein AphA